ncbi:AAA family ATPase [Limnothrix sp. PR1529]|uniref:AAA family ATPase n=1 Tax=Limnothrix sp. PR1529 TaxID=1704291 RepID=UPI000AABED05|nr:AAA family ATPase [Limnothrix sp. PR1529]
MEKLIIKNFAGLKSIEITINKINIIIGPQASGKSIVAKLLFYFRSFVGEIVKSGIKLEPKQSLDKKLKNMFEEYFPPDAWGNALFEIQYSMQDKYIKISGDTTGKPNSYKIALSYSDFYKKLLDQSRFLTRKIRNSVSPNYYEMWFEAMVFNQIQIQSILKVQGSFSEDSIFDQVFVPAGRSFFAVLKDNIFGVLSTDSQIDPFLIQFGQYYESIKRTAFDNSTDIKNKKRVWSTGAVDPGQTSLFDDMHRLHDNILSGKYVRLKDEDYLKSKDGRMVRLSNSSSGQQEILPLILVLESLCFFSNGKMGTSTYIEEPEAHLFPRTQRDIISLIATVYNFQPGRLHFFITTHSPYVLTAFNNLIQAGILSKSGHHDQVLEVMPASQVLDPDDVAAYHVVDGHAHNIIDPETQLIDAQIIDSISEELAIQFDQLLDIE